MSLAAGSGPCQPARVFDIPVCRKRSSGRSHDTKKCRVPNPTDEQHRIPTAGRHRCRSSRHRRSHRLHDHPIDPLRRRYRRRRPNGEVRLPELGDRRLPACTAVRGDQLIIGPIRHRSAPDPRTYNWASSLPGWQPNRGECSLLSNGYGASRSQDGQPDTALASSGSPRALNNVCCACWT